MAEIDVNQKSDRSPELFHRYKLNPILTGSHWPYPVNSIFNPGAVLLPDGATLVLCRVEDRRGISHLCAARSKNGIDNWKIDPQPTLSPDPRNFPEEEWGIEDPRITYLAELKKYVITYTAYSPRGPGISLALTPDFHTFERLGMIMIPENKDSAVFPQRIAGEWALIHRPSSQYGANIWLSSSPDLQHWGRYRPMLSARSGAWWDANKIGLSTPPIRTERGWLIIYHGVRQTPAGTLYRLGLALFDLEHPERLLKRSSRWIFGPEESYEVNGDVRNTVFPCGYTLAPDGDSLNMYYGGGDFCIALATAKVSVLLDWLEKDSSLDS